MLQITRFRWKRNSYMSDMLENMLLNFVAWVFLWIIEVTIILSEETKDVYNIINIDNI